MGSAEVVHLLRGDHASVPDKAHAATNRRPEQATLTGLGQGLCKVLLRGMTLDVHLEVSERQALEVHHAARLTGEVYQGLHRQQAPFTHVSGSALAQPCAPRTQQPASPAASSRLKEPPR